MGVATEIVEIVAALAVVAVKGAFVAGAELRGLNVLPTSPDVDPVCGAGDNSLVVEAMFAAKSAAAPGALAYFFHYFEISPVLRSTGFDN
ncbi:hypothetical protein FGB62_5g50 [Gracilaria domingensis]|nr:hypothetical protein FGB62_5g50 [Gracilaria domingensis]